MHIWLPPTTTSSSGNLIWVTLYPCSPISLSVFGLFHRIAFSPDSILEVLMFPLKSLPMMFFSSFVSMVLSSHRPHLTFLAPIYIFSSAFHLFFTLPSPQSRLTQSQLAAFHMFWFPLPLSPIYNFYCMRCWTRPLIIFGISVSSLGIPLLTLVPSLTFKHAYLSMTLLF